VISKFFIDRPVFATVMSVIIVLAGLMAMRALPVAQYPDIVPPQVVVQAVYPGASAETIAETVASPLEQEINGVDNMIYMQSSNSSSGSMQLTVTFRVGTDPDQATIDVNNRVQAAMAKLPEEVRRQGVQVKKQSTSILQVVTMYSPDGSLDPVYVSNYALLNVIDELKRTDGVGDAALFGAKDYSMRVWLRPDKLAQFGLTPSDVAAAIREQNSQFAAGRFAQEPTPTDHAFTYAVTTKGRLATAAEFEDIILRAAEDGAALRLGDVARVELGAQDYNFAATFDGKPAVAIGVYLQPGANAVATSAAVKETMERVAQRFPAGIAYEIPFDTTKFVEVSIDEVVKTFFEALLLVVAVMYLFLQNPRATIIPLLAVPVSLIGTFAGMYALGFSINLLTLLGMVLAIGIVVDDAIVVIENVERIMTEEGLPPREATIKAMREVTGPVIAIVLVLCAVFVPVGFLGGLAGQMYKQFAITIAISVAISGIVALTLTPALCALMLKPVHKAPPAPFRLFNRLFDKATAGYTAGVRFFLKRAVLGVAVLAVVTVAGAGLLQRLPSALVPEEDQGYIIGLAMLPPAAALNRTQEVTDALTADVLAQDAVEHVVTFAGFDLPSASLKTSAGVSFITLKDWDERPAPEDHAQSMVGRVMGLGAKQTEAMVFAINPPPITGMSITGGFDLFLQNRAGADYKTIAADANRVVAAANQRPELAGVRSTLSTNVPQYHVELDRTKAKALGVGISEVFAAMQSTFGSLYVNDFTLFSRTYRVSLQSEAEFREKPEDLRHVFVRSDNGSMIPLDSLVTVERVIGPELVDRFNAFPAAKIMGGPAPGYSSGQAIQAMQEVIDQTLSSDYSLGWSGSAYQELESGDSGAVAFTFGIIMVFLILAAQYERWSLPFAVVTAIPFAVLGAALAIWLRGLANDLYLQVGLLTLIGLSAKNAILIVEFAVLKRREGLSLMEAAAAAAKLRFRPIVMTSVAFILGCVPLALSSGAGAASRHSVGTGVIGGMLGATFLAVFFIPLFYRLIAGAAENNFGLKRRPKAEAVEDGSA